MRFGGCFSGPATTWPASPSSRMRQHASQGRNGVGWRHSTSARLSMLAPTQDSSPGTSGVCGRTAWSIRSNPWKTASMSSRERWPAYLDLQPSTSLWVILKARWTSTAASSRRHPRRCPWDRLTRVSSRSRVRSRSRRSPYGSSTLSLIHISEPTRLGMISYAVFCLKKKKKKKKKTKKKIYKKKKKKNKKKKKKK